MKLQFVEYLEQEQRVALVAAIVRRMADMDLLADDAGKEDAVQLALRIVGSTDMASVNQWATLEALVSVAGNLVEKVSAATSGQVVPKAMRITKQAKQLAGRLTRSSSPRYTAAVNADVPQTLITRKEVNSND